MRPLALVAEDRKFVRMQIVGQLESLGFYVDAASCGEDAKTFLDGVAIYDLVVLDQHMNPGPTGLELLAGMRRESSWPSVVMASCDISVARPALNLQAHYLDKGRPDFFCALGDLVRELFPELVEA